MAMLTVHRRGYTRKDGTEVRPTTFKIQDRGKRGRTPESEQWFEPQVRTGWDKNQPESIRRDRVLEAHKGDNLASARSMQALANVTTDTKTDKTASRDADHFFKQHRRQQRQEIHSRGTAPRITPKTPRIR